MIFENFGLLAIGANLSVGKGINVLLNNDIIYHKDDEAQSEKSVLYKLEPPSDIIDKRHSHKVHKILKQIENRVNHLYSKKKKGRVNCKTKDYRIYFSWSDGSLIVNVTCKKTERVFLSQRIRVGGLIAI